MDVNDFQDPTKIAKSTDPPLVSLVKGYLGEQGWILEDLTAQMEISKTDFIYATIKCPHDTVFKIRWACTDMILGDAQCIVRDAWSGVKKQCEYEHVTLPKWSGTPFVSSGVELNTKTVAPHQVSKKYPPNQSVKDSLYPLVPALGEYSIHPWPFEGSCQETATLSDMIVHLNDKHQWTREKIADWLDTLDLDLVIKPQSSGD